MLLEAQATFTPEGRRLLLFIQVFVVRDIPDASNYTFETFGSGQLLSFNFPAVDSQQGHNISCWRAGASVRTCLWLPTRLARQWDLRDLDQRFASAAA